MYLTSLNDRSDKHTPLQVRYIQFYKEMAEKTAERFVFTESTWIKIEVASI